MDNRKRTIIAIICGLVAIFVVLGYLHYRERELLQLAQAVDVVVAAKDIGRSSRIDETVLEVRRVPRKYLQPHAVTAADLSAVLGQVAASPIVEGEQILTTKLLRFGRSTGLALKVNPGMRAVSVLVDDVTGISRLVKPNDRVDVLATFDFGDKAKNKYYTFTLFQNVSVLAIDDDMGEGYSSLVRGDREENESGVSLLPGTKKENFVATLSMTPEQAQNLVLAQATGRITLLLRGLGESETILEMDPSTPATITKIDSLMKRNDAPVYQQYRGGRR